MKVVVNKAGLNALHSHLADNLGDAATLLRMAIQEKISIQGPPRSKPGEPPHIDTAELIKSYQESTDRRALKATVGSDAPQSIYTNLGTSRMAPRPHVIPALLENADLLAKEICKS